MATKEEKEQALKERLSILKEYANLVHKAIEAHGNGTGSEELYREIGRQMDELEKKSEEVDKVIFQS